MKDENYLFSPNFTFDITLGTRMFTETDNFITQFIKL